MPITYEQARADHEYLWAIGPAEDMTGGYVDQHDLAALLRSPTKTTARRCYVRQIDYWFQVGPDSASNSEIPWDDPMVCEIADRHSIAR